MSSNQIYRIKSLMIQGLGKAAKHASLKQLQTLGKTLGLFHWHRKTQTYQTTLSNISHCFPDMDEQARQQLIKNSLIHNGQTLMEMAGIWNKPVKPVKTWINKVENGHLLSEALQQQEQGLILIAPHLGNWELLNHHLENIVHFTAMYQPAKLAVLDEIILKARTNLNSSMVTTSNQGVKRLLKTLKAGDCVMILPDQEPADTSGCLVPFFGQEALTTTLAIKLLQKTKAQALIIDAMRNSAGGFTVCFSQPDPELFHEDLTTAVAAMNRSLEKAAMRKPEQYQWSYKRFKNHPPGGIY